MKWISGADGWAGEAHGHGDGHGTLLSWTALLCARHAAMERQTRARGRTGADCAEVGGRRRGTGFDDDGRLHTHLLELEFSPPTKVGVGVEGRDDATSNGVRIHLEVTSLTVKFWRTLASTRTHLIRGGRVRRWGVWWQATKSQNKKPETGLKLLRLRGVHSLAKLA